MDCIVWMCAMKQIFEFLFLLVRPVHTVYICHHPRHAVQCTLYTLYNIHLSIPDKCQVSKPDILYTVRTFTVYSKCQQAWHTVHSLHTVQCTCQHTRHTVQCTCQHIIYKYCTAFEFVSCTPKSQNCRTSSSKLRAKLFSSENLFFIKSPVHNGSMVKK